jgi:hypothetical protein
MRQALEAKFPEAFDPGEPEQQAEPGQLLGPEHPQAVAEHGQQAKHGQQREASREQRAEHQQEAPGWELAGGRVAGGEEEGRSTP